MGVKNCPCLNVISSLLVKWAWGILHRAKWMQMQTCTNQELLMRLIFYSAIGASQSIFKNLYPPYIAFLTTDDFRPVHWWFCFIISYLIMFLWPTFNTGCIEGRGICRKCYIITTCVIRYPYIETNVLCMPSVCHEIWKKIWSQSMSNDGNYYQWVKLRRVRFLKW